jgi:hypothetical protein
MGPTRVALPPSEYVTPGVYEKIEGYPIFPLTVVVEAGEETSTNGWPFANKSVIAGK